MNRIIYIILIAYFLPFTVTAQSWITKGDVWHYDYWNIGEVGFYKLNYDKDTVIQGHNCQIITDSIYTFYYTQNNTVTFVHKTPLEPEFTYNIGDSVFLYKDSSFWLLYNFNADIGDSWLISNDTTYGCLPTTITVTDTGHININNNSLRWIYIESNIGGKYYMKGKVVKSIGFLQSDLLTINTTLFPREVLCDTNIIVEYNFLSFKCFSNNSGLVYNPSGEDCEYYWTHQSIDISTENSLKLSTYPNPAKDHLNFKFSTRLNKNFTLTIYSSTGEMVFQQNIPPALSIYKIDISILKPGIYFYKLSSKTNNFSGKFINN